MAHRLAAGARVRADGLIVWDRTSPPGATVADAMIRKPKTCDSTATVGQLRQFFTDDHVHVALIVDHRRLLTVIERSDISRATPADTPARFLGRLAGRVTVGTESLELANRQMLLSGQRRLAVSDQNGLLLGLLCQKRSRAGFCTDQDIRDRADERTAGPASPAPSQHDSADPHREH